MFYETENDHGLPHTRSKPASCRARSAGSRRSTLRAGQRSTLQLFNILSYSPPYVLFSGGGHTEDRKDKINRQCPLDGRICVQYGDWDQREQMNNTGLIVDRTVSELAETGLETLLSAPWPAAHRRAGAPECKLHEIVNLPGHDAMSTHSAVFGVVVGVHIADDAITADGIFDVARHKPLSRLGYKDYAWTDESVIFQMKRTPKKISAAQAGGGVNPDLLGPLVNFSSSTQPYPRRSRLHTVAGRLRRRRDQDRKARRRRRYTQLGPPSSRTPTATIRRKYLICAPTAASGRSPSTSPSRRASDPKSWRSATC